MVALEPMEPAVSQRRSRELRLLLFAGAVVASGFAYLAALPSYDIIRSINFGVVFLSPAHGVPVLLPAAFLISLPAMNLVMRHIAPTADPILLPAASFLSGVGILFAYRLSPSYGTEQALAVLAGELACLAVVALPFEPLALRSFTYLFGIAGAVVLAATWLLSHLPGQALINGQTGEVYRMQLRLAGHSVQPTELAKVAFVLFFAGYLEERFDLLARSRLVLGPLRLPALHEFPPLVIVVTLCLILVKAQNDLGSGLLVLGVVLAMVYVGSGRTVYSFLGLLLFVVGVALTWRLLPTVHQRIEAWLNPMHAESAAQLRQGWIAVATGGLGGQGLGQGHPFFVPVVATDEVLSGLTEELGLAGALVLLTVELIVVLRGCLIALRTVDSYEKLLAFGLTALIAVQTLVITGGTLGLLPLTGVPLPLLSKGGSAAFATYLVVGLLLKLSRSQEAFP